MYKFNLESLLHHRKYTEEICQKELAESKRLLSDEKKKLKDYKKEKQKCWTQLQQKQKEGNPASEILVYIHYIERLSKDLAGQHQRCERSIIRVFVDDQYTGEVIHGPPA